MIKGVNKRIVEVKDPDSLYFERAVFYLRPNVSIIPDTVSHYEAEKLFGRIIPHDGKCSQKLSNKRMLLIVAAAVTILLFIKIF